jgi:hypothetical protein
MAPEMASVKNGYEAELSAGVGFDSTGYDPDICRQPAAF